MKNIYSVITCLGIALAFSNASYSVSLGETMQAAENIKYCNGKPLPPDQRTCNYGNRTVDVYSEQQRQLSEYERELMRKAYEPADESGYESSSSDNYE